ncbi:response regulator [Geothrix sp. 21YS21S-2]|uniref:response regulator n=1 Tax=Geothrix sp. 21YS21S-2 TaxID=3068893 RepID=UPI0027B9B42C|nr:response regulator [Geothrix sp. 21YS21S-2]
MPSKILSVDDSSTIRRIVGRVVATLGMEMVEAANGREALAVLERDHADIALVVLDVNMPEMDGGETLAAMKKDPRFQSIPVMMLTTESERGRILEFIQGGAANYLVKPFTPDDLAAKMAACMGDLF